MKMSKKKVSPSQKRATQAYEKRTYDKILVRFPKGTKQRIKESGAESINGFIVSTVLKNLK